MKKYCLLRGCCFGWINSVGRLQKLSPLGHPRLLGSSLWAPPACAHPLHAAAGKSQDLLAWKAPTKIIKVLKGAVQAIPAFCCPSGSANPAQAEITKPGSCVQAQPCEGPLVSEWCSLVTHPLATGPQPGAAPLQGSPRAAAAGTACADGDWHQLCPALLLCPAEHGLCEDSWLRLGTSQPTCF